MHVENTEMNEPDLRGVDFFSPDLPMLDTLLPSSRFENLDFENFRIDFRAF